MERSNVEMAEASNITSGEQRSDSQGVQVHQEQSSGGGDYHSGARTDGSGGRFITVGDTTDHTTNTYDANGNHEATIPRGDGGPAGGFMKSNP